MSNLCSSGLEPYTNSECDDIYGGGIRDAVIFIDELPEDPTDGNEINDLISQEKAVLLRDLKIGVSEPSPVTNPSMRSCSPETVSTYERELSWIDANVVDENVAFYNSLNASTGFEAVGVLLHECDAERATFIDAPINFTGGRIVPDDNNAEPQHFSFTGRWKSKGDPRIYALPAGVFV